MDLLDPYTYLEQGYMVLLMKLGRQKHLGLCEFNTSLVYKDTCRITWDTKYDHVFKNKYRS